MHRLLQAELIIDRHFVEEQSPAPGLQHHACRSTAALSSPC